jgi:cytoskeletal protein CcmA (bactofilin family)
MSRLQNESGQALLLVMMVLMMLLLLGSAALTRTGSSRVRSLEQQKMVQSIYIAEAGVEKALAYIKGDYLWLKGLTSNTEYAYISNLDYAGGQIKEVKITRTSSIDNPTSFCIESTGDYKGASRTLIVKGEIYDPIDFSKGVWIKDGLSIFSNNNRYDSDIISGGSLVFDNNEDFSGNILAEGSIILRNNAKAGSIVADHDVWLFNKVEVTTQVVSGNDLHIENYGVLTCNALAYGNINMGNNSKIKGDVKYNGSLSLGDDTLIEGTVTHGGVEPASVNLPAFPVLDESIFEDYPDIDKSGNVSGSFNVDGIFYSPGDLNISGTYQGNGLIVAHGKVNITGDLIRADSQSSLAIVAFGQDDAGTGIRSINNHSINALLYTPHKIVLTNNLEFYGSLICREIDVNSNGVVTYDQELNDNHKKWMTTVVKVKSWKELNPVF